MTGELAIMVGGAADAIERAEPILRAMGTTRAAHRRRRHAPTR